MQWWNPLDRNQALAIPQYILDFSFKMIWYISQFFSLLVWNQLLIHPAYFFFFFKKAELWSIFAIDLFIGKFLQFIINYIYRIKIKYKSLKLYKEESSGFCSVKHKWKQNKFHFWYFPTTLSLPLPFIGLCPVSVYMSQLAQGLEEPTLFLYFLTLWNSRGMSAQGPRQGASHGGPVNDNPVQFLEPDIRLV